MASESFKNTRLIDHAELERAIFRHSTGHPSLDRAFPSKPNTSGAKSPVALTPC